MPTSLTLLARVRSFLEDDDWPIEQVGDELHTTFEGTHGTWHVVTIVREDDGIVVVLSIAPLGAAPLGSLDAAEVVVRANHGLAIGGFDLDLASGAIQFRTAIDVHGEHEALTPGVLKHLLYQNVLTMDRFLPALRAVIEGGVRPEEALA